MGQTATTTRSAEQVVDDLSRVIRPYGRMLTAYSGGVDSTLVAAVGRQVLGRSNAPAAIADSASLPRRELHEARQIAEQLDLELIEVAGTEQADDRYQANDADRCYHCKSHLYDQLHRLAAELDIGHIANGTNADDPGDHRPGLQAAEQNRIVSPLLAARLGKADVRLAARHLSLPNHDKPAAACLASRLPYGLRVTPERLSRVEQAEAVLYKLGFTGFRVRHHETVARIELPIDQMPRLLDDTVRQQVIAGLTRVGYTYVTLDLAGFRSGSSNEALSIRPTK